MPYAKTNWNPGAAPGISAANLNNLETQYESAVADIVKDYGQSFEAVVTAFVGAGQFTAAGLIGLVGDDVFDGYYAYVMWDSGGAAAAPQGELRAITGFTAATGDVFHAAFTANLVATDVVLIIHPYIANLLGLTAARAGYLDNINQAGLLQVTAARAALLDQITAVRLAELDAANLPADVDAIVVGTSELKAVDNIALLDHFNRKGGVVPEADIWGVGGDAGFTVAMNVVDGEPSLVEVVTSGVIDELAYMNSNGVDGRVFSVNDDGITTVTFEARIKLLEATWTRFMIGLQELPLTVWAGVFASGAGFRCNGGVGATNIFAENEQAAATTTDTGIVQDTAWHKYRIVWTAASILYYIDDVLEATHVVVANIPTPPLLAGVLVYAGGAAVKHMRVDYIKVETS